MPQVIAAVIAGAAAASALRWIARTLERQAEAVTRSAEDARKNAEAARAPQNLGALEYDPVAQVYRPVIRN